MESGAVVTFANCVYVETRGATVTARSNDDRCTASDAKWTVNVWIRALSVHERSRHDRAVDTLCLLAAC